MASKRCSPEILRDKYQKEYSFRFAFEEQLKQVLKQILHTHDICHIESRTKQEDNFIAKAFRPGKLYKKPFEEITDITGIRIIVEYKDEAEIVAKKLRETLSIDEKHSRDTAKDAPTDVFGYSSIHLVARLPLQIQKETNLQAFGDRAFEIQIRTKLEDAWAAKSRHYLYNKEVSADHRRIMNRLSALLELADESFVTLKDEMGKSFTSTTAPLQQFPPLENSAITSILKSDVIHPFISELASLGLGVTETERTDHLQAIAAILSRQGLKTVEDVRASLTKRTPDMVYAAAHYMKATTMTSFPLDTLLVAALAIIDNGSIPPEDFAKGWSTRWREGFVTAAHEFQAHKSQATR